MYSKVQQGSPVSINRRLDFALSYAWVNYNLTSYGKLLIATVFRGQALHLITELTFAPDFMCGFRKWNKIFRKVRVVSNLRAMCLYNLDLLEEYELHLSLMFSTVFINRHSWCGTYSHSNLRDQFSSRIVTISAAEGDVTTVKSLATLQFFLGHTKESNHSGCQKLRKETKESSRELLGEHTGFWARQIQEGFGSASSIS